MSLLYTWDSIYQQKRPQLPWKHNTEAMRALERFSTGYFKWPREFDGPLLRALGWGTTEQRRTSKRRHSTHPVEERELITAAVTPLKTLPQILHEDARSFDRRMWLFWKVLGCVCSRPFDHLGWINKSPSSASQLVSRKPVGQSVVSQSRMSEPMVSCVQVLYSGLRLL